MDEEALNMSVRKFLKTVGVTSQREIEKAVRAAAETGRLPETGEVAARAVIRIEGIDLEFTIDGTLTTKS